MPEDQGDLTQELQPAGHTSNLYLSPEETVVISEGESDDEPFRLGKHSRIPSGFVDDSAFIPKTAETEDEEQGRAKRSHRRSAIIAVVTTCIICIVVGAVVAFVYLEQRHAQALEPHPVTLRIDAPGYDLSDSKIPFLIQGVDVDGKQVNSVGYVDPSGQGVELGSGDYILSVASSPLLDDAQFYEVPSVQIEVTVSQDLETGEIVEATSPKAEFMFAAPADITDEQIQLAYDYAVDSGFNPQRAMQYRDALIAKRDEARAQAQNVADKQQRLQDATQALEAKARERGIQGVSYKLVDLDGDELPELILAGNAGSPVGAMCFVYAYDAFSHQVVELCSAAGGANHAPGIWFSPVRHEVVFSTTGTNRESYEFYSIAPDRAIVEYVYVHTWTASDRESPQDVQPDVYTVNDQPFSQQGFNDMVSSLSSFSYMGAP